MRFSDATSILAEDILDIRGLLAACVLHRHTEYASPAESERRPESFCLCPLRTVSAADKSQEEKLMITA